MGFEKFRRPTKFLGGASFTGSVGLAGTVSMTGSAAASPQSMSGPWNFQNAVTVGGKLTVNTVPAVKANSWTTTSAGGNPNAFAGLTTVGCGVASVVVSNTVVKSNSIIQVTPIARSALSAQQASGQISGMLAVTTITEGGFFTVGWLGGVGHLNSSIDAAWVIILQA